ncbi:septal ring lytic transglycosylase RlpA family protein [Bordetella tumulicola]
MLLKNTRQILTPLLVGLAVVIAGCTSTAPSHTGSQSPTHSPSSSSSTSKGGGYYKDDGPERDVPAGIEKTADAIPQLEPLSRGGNSPYKVFGKRYVPITDENKAYKVSGKASWYGKKFHGRRTSNGETYDMYAMTAAHPTLPIPSYARVTSSVNGRTVIVRINDRGPFHRGRIVDLSYTAAKKLGLIKVGSAKVTVERILPEEIRLAQAEGTNITGTPAPDKIAQAPKAKPTPAPVGKLTMKVIEPEAQPTPSPTAKLAAKETKAESKPTPSPIGTLTTKEVAPAPASNVTRVASRSSGPSMLSRSDGIYLQMGAFSQPTNAQALVQRVNSQLDNSSGDTAVVQQNAGLYRVRLGPYVDRAAALDVARQVASQTGILPQLAAQ